MGTKKFACVTAAVARGMLSLSTNARKMVDLFGALSRANTQPNSFIAWIGVDHAADSAQGPWDRRNLAPMIPDLGWRPGDPRRAIKKEDPLGTGPYLESAQSAIADPGTVCVYRRRAGTTVREIRFLSFEL